MPVIRIEIIVILTILLAIRSIWGCISGFFLRKPKHVSLPGKDGVCGDADLDAKRPVGAVSLGMCGRDAMNKPYMSVPQSSGTIRPQHTTVLTRGPPYTESLRYSAESLWLQVIC